MMNTWWRRGFTAAFALVVLAAAAVTADEKSAATTDNPAGDGDNGRVMLFPIVKDAKWGYMDEKGAVVIEPQYDQAFDFSEGLACVAKYPWRGYIDRTGKMVVEPQFTWAGPFREGMAPVLSHTRFYGRHANYYGATAANSRQPDVKEKIRSGFIDRSGKPVKGVPLSTSGVGEGKVLLSHKKGTEVYGTDGKKCEHDADQVCQFADGMAAARKGDRWGYIDHEMKWVIEPQFHEVDEFSAGLAGVMKSDPPPPEKADSKTIRQWQETRKVAWGFIDKSGQLVIDYRFGDAWPFSEGLAPVRVDGPSTDSTGTPRAGSGQGKWGYIDTTGTVVIEPTYDYAWPFSEGLARVMADEKQGFIDKKGAVVVEPEYRPAWEFSKGLARVQLKDEDGFREGYINKKGEYVWEPTK